MTRLTFAGVIFISQQANVLGFHREGSHFFNQDSRLGSVIEKTCILRFQDLISNDPR